MNISLLNKTALVTGASRGLGLAIAGALATAGANVLLLGRNQKELQAAATSMGPKASPFVCDVTNSEALKKTFATLGQLHILVNNAGTNIPEAFLDVTEEHYDQIFNLNMRATFFATQQALPHMQTGAVIINMSSQMGHVGAINRSVYCASKHAVEGFTKALAVELAPRGIRVVSVAPTFIETELTKPMFLNPIFKQSVEEQIPLGKIGQVQDVAGAIVFLASEHANLVTGSSLKLDGGWTAK